jgi:hypothetical protein
MQSKKFWYGRFVWRDWLTDPGLRRVSFAARGLWIDLLCHAWQDSEPGYLTFRSCALSDSEVAKLVGADRRQVIRLLLELEDAGVFSRDERGAIYSRRMVADLRESREMAERGRRGGNPVLSKNKGLHQNQDNLKVKPNSKESLDTIKEGVKPSASRQPALPLPVIADGGNVEQPAVEVLSAREIVWRHGPAMVAYLTGKSDRQSRGILGKMLSITGDDCSGVMRILEHARSLHPLASAEAHLIACAQHRAPGGSHRAGGKRPPGDVSDWAEALNNRRGDIELHAEVG